MGRRPWPPPTGAEGRLVSHQPYQPGYFLLPGLPVDRQPVRERSRGPWVNVRLEAECLTPLYVGSGVPEIVRLRESGRMLVQGFARVPTGEAQVRVVPGSSVKGAVRALVEALTPSCERTGGDACRDTHSLCPACALLGAPGWRGLVVFGDLRPVEGQHAVAALRIAQRHSHRDAPRRGRRLYRRRPESPQPREEEWLLVLDRGSRLQGEVLFAGTTEAELGVVALALGLPPHGPPYLRLGGGKNRGLGAVRLSAQSVEMLELGRVHARMPLPPQFIERCESAAFGTFPSVRERLEVVRRHYEDR